MTNIIQNKVIELNIFPEWNSLWKIMVFIFWFLFCPSTIYCDIWTHVFDLRTWWQCYNNVRQGKKLQFRPDYLNHIFQRWNQTYTQNVSNNPLLHRREKCSWNARSVEKYNFTICLCFLFQTGLAELRICLKTMLFKQKLWMLVFLLPSRDSDSYRVSDATAFPDLSNYLVRTMLQLKRSNSVRNGYIVILYVAESKSVKESKQLTNDSAW